MPRLRIAILEDSDRRLRDFRNRIKMLIGECVIHSTKDVHIMLSCIQKDEYDFLFIDHDLHITHYSNSNVDLSKEIDLSRKNLSTGVKNGKDFAFLLSKDKKALNNVKNIYIHSLNPIGSRNIQHVLSCEGKHSELSPFAWELENLKKIFKQHIKDNAS
jgi:hypothetical protein